MDGATCIARHEPDGGLNPGGDRTNAGGLGIRSSHDSWSAVTLGLD